MQRFTLDSPKTVGDHKDHWIILDASELYDFADSVPGRLRPKVSGSWYGGDFNQARELCRSGDLDVVAKSDALLSEMSAYMPESGRRGYLMDVAGAVPSIPTFLSGNPLNMRRRIKVRDEYAPLAIVFDPTCSAALNVKQIFQRGITVLALVRALAGLRPIELWVLGGLNGGTGGYDASFVATRIETAPLDLARAAWMLTSSLSIRGISYSLLETHCGATGGWPYRDHDLCKNNFREIVLQALPHVSDVLAIPSIHIADELVNDPRAWLARTFKELTGQSGKDAA